ncbi:DUF6928 family protein [Neptuniibacter sp. PT8_73]|uniref:DUF6928 family protein n=1 Tax=Neptuniibacter sp. PT8_73 TaxID=3398206 RepID=UPI0039F48731
MGAKTWMLVYSNGDAAENLKKDPVLNQAATAELLQKLFPNENLESIEGGDLSYTNPPDEIIFAGCFGEVSVIAAVEFAGDYPSRVDPRFIDPSLGENIYLHAMHSVVDWFAFATWKEGQLTRALSLSPDSGILEDIGEKLPFELEYWKGKHPALDPEEEDEFDYPFSFHPLELGEAALQEFFGYQLEGFIDDSLIEPETIPLMGFKRSVFKPWWKVW